MSQHKDSDLEFVRSPFHLFAQSVAASKPLATFSLLGTPLDMPVVKGTAHQTSKVLDLSAQNLNPLSGILIGALVAQHTRSPSSRCITTRRSGRRARAIVDRLSPAALRTLDLNSVIPALLPASATPVQIRKKADRLSALCVSIGRLHALEKLTLDRNSLSELPGIGELRELKGLTLNNNRIETFPEQLCFLRSLKRLAARANRLLELPSAIGQLEALESLDLKANRLTYLPASIGQL